MVMLAPLLSSSVVACNQVPKFPNISIYDIDTDAGVCGRYRIVKQNPITLEWVEDLPLKSCNGNLSVTPRGFTEIKLWAEEVVEIAKRSCRAPEGGSL